METNSEERIAAADPLTKDTPETNSRFTGHHDGAMYYNGDRMCLDFLNLSYDTLVEGLAFGEFHHIQWEPGDSTRYSFYIAPLSRMWGCPVGISGADKGSWFLVSREIGGKIVGSCVLRAHTGSWDTYVMAVNNDWSSELFGWFFNRLFIDVQAKRKEQ